MGLQQKISDFRERQILERAEPSLDPGELVTHWIRVRDPGRRGGGVVYLTDRRCIFYWSGRATEPAQVPWEKVRSWGVDRKPARGPVLGVETAEDTRFVQILVGTDGMVEKVNGFLERFAAIAPPPLGPLAESSHPHDYSVDSDLRVDKEKKSLTSHTRRVIVTIIGVLLMAAGIVLLVVPGPGILVTFAGLAVLGSEYDWAQDILAWARERYRRTREKLKARSSSAD